MAFCLLLASCSRQPAAGDAPSARGANPAAPVTVALTVKTNVPVQVREIGHVVPCSTVSVMSQVDGLLARIQVAQGAELKEGQLIFEIDAAPFEASLRQAEAVLARDSALAKKAELDVERSNELFARQIESADVHEQTLANAAALKAQVLADQAAVDNARVQLAYCSIRSPINGRAGRLLVNAGNIIRKQDTTLLVINQTKPIYVDFSAPEKHLPDIRKYMAAGKLTVEAAAPRQEHPSTGELLLINNTVDTNTGNISLRATFANEDEALWPGQFVDATLTLTTQNRIVVPASAIQDSQNGQFVYVVKPDMTVEARPVNPGARMGESISLAGGKVQPGEQVVISGQLRLIPGAKVVIQNPASATNRPPGSSKP